MQNSKPFVSCDLTQFVGIALENMLHCLRVLFKRLVTRENNCIFILCLPK